MAVAVQAQEGKHKRHRMKGQHGQVMEKLNMPISEKQRGYFLRG